MHRFACTVATLNTVVVLAPDNWVSAVLRAHKYWDLLVLFTEHIPMHTSSAQFRYVMSLNIN